MGRVYELSNYTGEVRGAPTSAARVLAEGTLVSSEASTRERTRPATTETEVAVREEDVGRNNERASASRLYPQLLDTELPAGAVYALLISARRDAEEALAAYSRPDLAEVESRLALVAACMAKAHRVTQFNESLGAVVSHIRRAMLVTPSDVWNTSSLSTLVFALSVAEAEPMMKLARAAGIVRSLEQAGWVMENAAAKVIETFLLGPDDSSPRTQADLFATIQENTGNQA